VREIQTGHFEAWEQPGNTKEKKPLGYRNCWPIHVALAKVEKRNSSDFLPLEIFGTKTPLTTLSGDPRCHNPRMKKNS
jgi:hypothetical protein